MKRYLLFAGKYYYPAGGIHDFIMDADDPKPLKDHGTEQIETEFLNWWHIYDSFRCKIIDAYPEYAYKPLWD